jgi:hypothetical protein
MTFFESPSRPIFLFEHDLFGKPVPTFPDHALIPMGRFVAKWGPIPQGQSAPISLIFGAEGQDSPAAPALAFAEIA